MNDNEQINYADMIEIPVNTCTVTSMPAPKKRTRKKKPSAEEIKSVVIAQVNDSLSATEKEDQPTQSSQEEVADFLNSVVAKNTSTVSENDFELEEPETSKKSVLPKVRGGVFSLKKRIIIGVVAVVVLAVATLGAGILTDSLGLTAYFGEVFAPVQQTVKEYDDYQAGLPCLMPSAITVDNGVMSVANKGSVYSSTDGTVSKVVFADGKYSLEITHGEDFRTVIEGLDYSYVAEGDGVYGKIPVGYSLGEGYTVCLYSSEGLITDYDISGGTVSWNATTSDNSPA